MNVRYEIVSSLKRALDELEKPMPPIVAGENGWNRAYEYARRVGFTTASIKDALQLLGDPSTSV